MVMIDDSEQAKQGAGSRSGGNVQTKGASQAPAAETDQAETRGGGNIQTKGASKDPQAPTSDEKNNPQR